MMSSKGSNMEKLLKSIDAIKGTVRLPDDEKWVYNHSLEDDHALTIIIITFSIMIINDSNSSRAPTQLSKTELFSHCCNLTDFISTDQTK